MTSADQSKYFEPETSFGQSELRERKPLYLGTLQDRDTVIPCHMCMSYIVRWFVTGVPRWVWVGKEDCGLRAAYANLTRNLCGLHHQPHSFSPTITCCKEEAAHTAAVVPNPLRRSISPFTATCTKRATNLIMLGSRLRHVGPCIYMVASSRPYKTPVFGDLELPAFSGGSNKFDNDWESVASRRPVRLHGVCTFQTLPDSCIWRTWIASVQI